MNIGIVFENVVNQYDSYGVKFTKIVSSVMIQCDGRFVYIKNGINVK